MGFIETFTGALDCLQLSITSLEDLTASIKPWDFASFVASSMDLASGLLAFPYLVAYRLHQSLPFLPFLHMGFHLLLP